MYLVLYNCGYTNARLSISQKAMLFRPFDVPEINRNTLVHSSLFQSTRFSFLSAPLRVFDLPYLLSLLLTYFLAVKLQSQTQGTFTILLIRISKNRVKITCNMPSLEGIILTFNVNKFEYN